MQLVLDKHNTILKIHSTLHQEKDSKQKQNKLTNLILAHDMLCDSFDIMNKCYGPQYIIELGSILAYTIFCVFGFTHYTLKGSMSYVHWALYFSSIVWDFMYFYYVLMIIIFSNWIKKEGKRTGNLAQKLFGCRDVRTKV